MLRVISISRSAVVLSVLAAAGCSQADDGAAPGEDAGLGFGAGGGDGGGSSLGTGGTTVNGTAGSVGKAGSSGSTAKSAGGSANSGGANATNSGGASQAGTTNGGAPSTGGTPNAGGTLGIAGSQGTGGTSNTGGATGTGGIAGTGGKTGTGGATGTGGITGTGGSSCTCSNGGTTGTGGKTGTGGVTGTGGKTGTGGVTGSGGVTGTGGTTATGGAGGACVTGSGPLPTIGGCTVFKSDSPWNTQINCAPVHSRNTQFMAAFDIDSTHRAVHLDLGSTETQYGIPSTVVPANQSTVPITYGVGGENYATESDPGPFPIPLNAPIEGQNGATDPTSGDRHVLVVQQGTCTLFELYKTVRVTASPAGFKCAASAKWDLSINSSRPAGWTSADAAGLPIFPGLIRYAEIQAGAINHALRVTAPNAQNSYIPPASHTGPNDDPTLPPYGLRIRLKSSFGETQYSAEAKVLLKALKTYGLIYADQGTGWYISGSSDPGLENLIDEIHNTRPIPSSAFEAVYTGDTVCGWGAPAVCK